MALSSDRTGGRPPPASPPATPNASQPVIGVDAPAAPLKPDSPSQAAARIRKLSRANKPTGAETPPAAFKTTMPLLVPPDEIAENPPETAGPASLEAPGDTPAQPGQPGAAPPPPAVSLLFDEAAWQEPQPPPMPDASSPPVPAPARGRQARLGLWVMLILILLLAGAMAYLLVAFRQPGQAGKPPFRTAEWPAWLSGWLDKKPGPAHGGAPATRPAAEPPTARPYTNPLRQTQAVIQAVLAARQAMPFIHPPPSEPSRPAAADPGPSETPVSVAPAAAPLSQSDLPGEDQVAARVVWPEVVISATVGGGTRGSALINGVLLTVGEETKDGLLLVKIEPRAAVLTYKGETRRFIVGKR